MDFLSISFVLLLLTSIIVNYYMPQNVRIIGLLFISFVFYYEGAKQFVILVLAMSFITYLFGRILSIFRKNYIYIVGVLSILIALIYYKYADFLVGLISRISVQFANYTFGEIVAPLGISFMTFQAISYLGDVYYGKINAEKNPLIVTLYICFFANITSGPIQKARTFIPSIKVKPQFNYSLVKHGLMSFVFGALQKFYISDKLAPMVNSMQNSLIYEEGHSGFHYIFFAFTYAIYLYSNFNSYSDMAIGIAEILGLKYSENFKRPYLSRTIKEFWQRWHISLNSWFVEYVYIPLGGSRKGKIRYYSNIMIIFFLSGLWHGASVHFIAWGLLNGFYQIIGNLTYKYREKLYVYLKIDPSDRIIVFCKRLCVFYLISISWIFFTIPSTKLAVQMIFSMLVPRTMSLFDGWIFNQFESVSAAICLLSTIMIFALVQSQRERASLMEKLSDRPVIIRYLVYTLLTTLLLFGFFGTFNGIGNGGFVYGNF